MPENIHKGTELNNVKETWERNERENLSPNNPAAADNDLQGIVKKEASEYDKADKEERLLAGDRASVKDESGSED